MTATALSPAFVTGTVVGLIALAWPSSLAVGERRFSIATLLEDLYQIDKTELPAIANSGGSIELPYTLATSRKGDDLQLTVIQSQNTERSNTKVYAAKYDPVSNQYSVTLGNSVGTITWSPIDSPGNDALGTPGLPSLPNEATILKGPKITPTPPTIEIFPVHAVPSPKNIIVTFPADSGLPPVYLMFSNPYDGATTKGAYSGRPFNPDKAGGPILDLDWSSATITQDGINSVKLHTSRFKDSGDENAVMIDRLERIFSGNLELSDTDKRFYTHELRELERYRALSIADGVAPTDLTIWNNAHTATLEDFKLPSNDEVLYTAEALEAGNAQIWRL